MPISKPFQNNDNNIHKNLTPKQTSPFHYPLRSFHSYLLSLPNAPSSGAPAKPAIPSAVAPIVADAMPLWMPRWLSAPPAWRGPENSSLEAYWSPQVGGWVNHQQQPCISIYHEPSTTKNQPQQQPQPHPQSSLLCPASANDSPAPVKERCISTISTFNSPMRFIFLDNGTLKIRLKWRNK